MGKPPKRSKENNAISKKGIAIKNHILKQMQALFTDFYNYVSQSLHSISYNLCYLYILLLM